MWTASRRHRCQSEGLKRGLGRVVPELPHRGQELVKHYSDENHALRQHIEKLQRNLLELDVDSLEEASLPK